MRHPFEGGARGYRYAIGIDLGTTNTAVAYVDLAAQHDGAARRAIAFFDVPQLVAPGALARRAGLPSFLYLPGAHDLPPGSTALPWDGGRTYVVGELAREQGVRVPGRLVASAKSWLCHDGVARTAPILPWDAPAEIPKVSPVEASRRYLQHIREAWDERTPGAPFDEQLVILTVPASFDEVARELTVEAAQAAGLTHAILLEEPLAAFYAWVADHERAWQGLIRPGQLILVCDVGGGTTDFSIVGLRAGEDGPRFDRLAVGDHLMLGGDNMDYALGRHVEAQMTGAPGRLDTQRWHQLVHGCRKAKERLLGEGEAKTVTITVTGTGGKLIAGTLKGTLTHQDVQQLLLDGFFPDVALDEPLEARPRKGLTELGLPYVHDPAITRHLAAFWRRAQPYLRDQMGRDAVYPDYLLFNGGVLTPAALRDRLKRIVEGWFAPVAGAGWAPIELHNPRPDLAVAMGAAYYGLVRLGEGIRVGSSSPRAYYVGVETGRKDGADPAQTAVCLVPRGVDEGFVGRLDHRAFEALTNQPVTFYLFSSTTRTGDALGDVVHLAPDEAAALPPVRSVLQFGKKGIARSIPIQLAVRLTEIGTLELWCQSRITEHRWQLQFDVRREPEPDAERAPALDETLDPAWIEEARSALERLFAGAEPPRPEHTWHQLEAALHTQPSDWPIPVLRKLADTLLAVPRHRSAAHEALWLDLLGYDLRPGYGDPVDEWRMQQAWKLHLEGLHFPDDVACRTAWWVFWRRVAGGLPAEKQAQIYHEVRPYLQLKVLTKKKHRVYPRRMDPREQQEAWRALAHFERLPSDIKVTLGRLLLQKMKLNKMKEEAELWALCRLGARRPAYGPLDCLVPSDEVASWVKAILTSYPPRREYVGYALVHLTRPTGDRNRDVPDETRHQVYRWLRKLPDEDRLRALLEDPEAPLSQEEQEWFLAESLPPSARAELDPHGLAYTATGEAPTAGAG